MSKKMLAITILLLFAIVFPTSLASCRQTPEGPIDPVVSGDSVTSKDTSETESAEPVVVEKTIKLDDLKKYTIIYPERGDPALQQAAETVQSKIEHIFGVLLPVKNDFYRENSTEYAIGEYEILIGETNREETEAFLCELRSKDRGYALVGEKIVILGHTVGLTNSAVFDFNIKILNEDAAKREYVFGEADRYIKAGSYQVQEMVLCDRPIREYTIVYAVGNQKQEKRLAELLQGAIVDFSGNVLQVVASNKVSDVAAAIYVGEAPAATAVTKANYLLGVDGGNVYACGADIEGNAKAVNDLIVRLQEISADKTVNCCLEALQPIAIDAGEMSAMSFNLRYIYDTARGELILRHILNNLPDTVGVQEAVPKWMSYLKDALGSYYDCVGNGRDGGAAGEYNAIFYAKDKFNLIESGTKWLSNTPDDVSKLNGSDCNRIYTYAILERKSDGKRILFVNTHLDNNINDTGKLQQAQVVLDFLAKHSDLPIICTGDFNAPYNSSVYKKMIQGRLDDPMTAVGATPSATYHGGDNSYTSASSCIDFCFVTTDKIKPTAYRVCNQKLNETSYASDHHPVCIKYQLK